MIIQDRNSIIEISLEVTPRIFLFCFVFISFAIFLYNWSLIRVYIYKYISIIDSECFQGNMFSFSLAIFASYVAMRTTPIIRFSLSLSRSRARARGGGVD